MTDQSFYNFQTVLAAVYSQIDNLIQHLLPEAKKQAGNYRCGDLSGAKGSSLSISTRPNSAGLYHDHADPSVKGNAIGLWASVKGCSYDEAGKQLAQFLGVQPEERIYMPRSKPSPRINKEEHTFMCGDQTFAIKPLSRKAVEYAKGRGIDQPTLNAHKCASTDNDIIFPHFDEDSHLCMVKCWPCDGSKRIYTNSDPTHTLFGKHLVDPLKTGATLIITEGQWDSMTWQQLGYPAVSIPSGVNNFDWIGEDYNFLNRFSQIFLDFDDDAPGKEAEEVVKNRLGHERCRAIRYGFKDANAALQAGKEQALIEAYQQALSAPVERIINPLDIMEQVRNRLNGTDYRKGTPFFLPKLNFEFRPHEVTVWFGTTSHGKSTVLSNQIAYAASLGKMSMVACFEQSNPMTVSAMVQQYTSDADIGKTDDFKEAYLDLTSKVLFYDSMEKTSPDELISTMVRAHKQLGIEEFVIDNVMTLEVDRQDNTAQADVANKLRVFVSRYPVHLHLVAHPRKPKENDARPPSIHDIMGASEWSAMAHSIICVWRDVAKQTKMSEMRDENIDFAEINAYDKEIPDGKIFIRKNRESGDLPMISYWFEKSVKRAWKDPEDLCPYFYPDNHEQSEDNGQHEE